MNKPWLTAKFRKYVAEQAGFILMHLLADDLPDDLGNALWCEDGDAVRAWCNRELPPEILQAIPAGYQQQFLAGAYSRYFDDFVVRPRKNPALPSRGDGANTPSLASLSPLVTYHAPTPQLSLSPEDAAHVANLEKSHQMIRDRVNGVIQGFHTGFYLWGESGTSKTYTVTEELRQRGANYVLHNSHMTTRAFVQNLMTFPTILHVFDDCEPLLENPSAWGPLRSSLWCHDNDARYPVRLVTHGIYPKELRFEFTGGIIMIGNQCLLDTSRVRALGGRITVLEHAATFAEIAAYMRYLALSGYEYDDDHMTPIECMTVAEYIIQRMRQLGRNLDLRAYKSSLKDYLQHRSGNSANDWKELIDARLRGTTTTRGGDILRHGR